MTVSACLPAKRLSEFSLPADMVNESHVKKYNVYTLHPDTTHPFSTHKIL